MAASNNNNNISIRPARHSDIPSITSITNHYILETVLTFATEPKTPAELEHTFQQIESAGLPFLVACEREDPEGRQEAGVVVGYSYVTGFRDERPAYRSTLELSLFCHPDHVRRGIGKRLLDRILEILTWSGRDHQHQQQQERWVTGDRLRRYPPRELLAVMAVDTDGPDSGLGLRDWYVRYGFTVAGHLRQVGFKKDRWVDVLLLQLSIRPPALPSSSTTG